MKEHGDQGIMAARTRRPPGLTIVAALALLQGVLGLLRSFEIVRFGVNLTAQGVLLLPLLGILTAARGGLVAIIALLYLLFAVGALRQHAWSWWVGLAAALLNGLLVVNAMAQGASVCSVTALGDCSPGPRVVSIRSSRPPRARRPDTPMTDRATCNTPASYAELPTPRTPSRLGTGMPERPSA